jgi:hypothetical protein
MTMKRRKMVGAYSTHGKEEKCVLILCWENPIERDLLKYLSLNWRIILRFVDPCIANTYIPICIQQDATLHSYICKLLYMFLVVSSSIIRNAYNCIYSIWYLSHRTAVSTPRWRQIAVTVWQIPDAVDTVVCAPDDGWRYHPKHVE